MRQDRGTNGEHRSSALWGKGSRGLTRGNALWGRGGRGAVALFALVAIMVPTAGTASSGNSAVVPASLLQRAQADQNGSFDVIITAEKNRSSRDIAKDAENEHAKVKRQFKSISGVSVSVSGKDLLKLARNSHVLSIVPDQQLKAFPWDRLQALKTRPQTYNTG